MTKAHIPRCWAVIPAAGKGARMGAELPKQYLPLLGQSILEHTIRRFTQHSMISGVVVAVAGDDEHWPLLKLKLPPVMVAPGGTERCESVLNALHTLSANAAPEDWVLVHDAARPCVHADDITRLIDQLEDNHCGGILGMAVRDTLKRCSREGVIEDTVDRTHLWHALTPQMFRYAMLRSALEAALAKGVLVTDEAQAIELSGGLVRMVEGRSDNLKITRPEDLALAALFLRAQQQVNH
jgi:2-C-methyl-D-erythritol 4-phosphate cytidylyltransferase